MCLRITCKDPLSRHYWQITAHRHFAHHIFKITYNYLLYICFLTIPKINHILKLYEEVLIHSGNTNSLYQDSMKHPLQMVAAVPWPQATYVQRLLTHVRLQLEAFHSIQCSNVHPDLQNCVPAYFHWMHQARHCADRAYSIPFYKARLIILSPA